MDIYIHISTNSNAIYSMRKVSPNSNLAVLLKFLLFDSLCNNFNKKCERSFVIQAIPMS